MMLKAMETLPKKPAKLTWLISVIPPGTHMLYLKEIAKNG